MKQRSSTIDRSADRNSLANDTDRHLQFYQALVDKDAAYDGVIYFGIRTTGIFCRPTCTARKPKFENCQYFDSAQDAILAGYRPCKRCQPLTMDDDSDDMVKRLVQLVDNDPQRRWTEADFVAAGIDSTTARRRFKKRFGMTFVAYARSRRLGLAVESLRKGKTVTNAQWDAGYESDSGFRDAFSRILGDPPKGFSGEVSHMRTLTTPLGPMIAVANRDGLSLLEFANRRGLERELERLRNRTGTAILPGSNPILDSIEGELKRYFADGSYQFKTPLNLIGTAFQKEVWQALLAIPPGEVRSYAQQATAIGRTGSFRAVARANGSNQIAIVIPCHRVIGSDGKLTGYAGGLPRKEWLLDHEKRDQKQNSGS